MTWQERWETALMANYGTPPVLLERGAGSRVWDDEGREYVDLIGGIAVDAVGHAHPSLVAAVTDQLQTLGHVSNLAANEPVIDLAERLVALAGGGARAFFCNSGAEANEAAFKMSRLTGRTHVVVAEGSFHGRTMGSLALTAQPAKQDPFRPLPGDVTTVPFGDADALAAAVTSETAAVFLEPIQGEGGVIVPPLGYLAAARAACDAAGALLVLDEVQTGIGRTGPWFAWQAEGVRPDVMTLAKGLAGGLPMGAVLGFGAAGDLLTPGSHGSTFGGNPVSSRAALAVLDILEAGVLAQVPERSARLVAEIPQRAGGLVSHVRGRGLLLAAVVEGVPAKEVEAALRANGVLANAVSADAIRMAPALTITDADIDAALDAWAAAAADLGVRA